MTVSPIGVHKWRGVRAFCAHHGIDDGAVLAVGDGLNDIELLQALKVVRGRTAEQEAGGGERPDLVAGGRRPERRPLRQRQDLHQAAVALRPRHGRRIEKARGPEQRRAPLVARRGTL